MTKTEGSQTFWSQDFFKHKTPFLPIIAGHEHFSLCGLWMYLQQKIFKQNFKYLFVINLLLRIISQKHVSISNKCCITKYYKDFIGKEALLCIFTNLFNLPWKKRPRFLYLSSYSTCCNVLDHEFLRNTHFLLKKEWERKRKRTP